MEYLGLTTYTLFPFQAPQCCRHIWMPNGFRDFLKGFLACLLSCGFWKTWPLWEKSFERPQMHITSMRALRGQSCKDGAMTMYWFETVSLTITILWPVAAILLYLWNSLEPFSDIMTVSLETLDYIKGSIRNIMLRFLLLVNSTTRF